MRLDAIAYLWKIPGTSCIHLPQTHAVIRLLRAVLDRAAPNVLLITETNVPHSDNISYFGGGRGEAQMVYNFALPPLALHAAATGQVSALREWAASLQRPGDQAAFFNFLASHDGIGLNPARGILAVAQHILNGLAVLPAKPRYPVQPLPRCRQPLGVLLEALPVAPQRARELPGG